MCWWTSERRAADADRARVIVSNTLRCVARRRAAAGASDVSTNSHLNTRNTG